MSEIYAFIIGDATTDIDKVLSIVLFFMFLEIIFKVIMELIKIGNMRG